MLKNMAKGLGIFLVIVLCVGCSSTQTSVKTEGQTTTTTVKRLETRFYAEDRDRVDQEMEGNFGYVGGTPIPEDRSDAKTTRRVYVFEVTKNTAEAAKVENVKIEPYKPAPSRPLPPVDELSEPEPAWSKPVAIPAITTDEGPKGAPYMEDYVVQEGDTLQKIAKKFYDSYSQWLKIFEANKEVLKDPNRIKPGMKIQIPMNQ